MADDNQQPDDTIPQRQHIFLMAVRQALIIILGALEEYLGMERSIVPRHKRITTE